MNTATGQAARDGESKTGASPRFCVKCGIELVSPLKYCPSCGHAVTDGAPKRASVGNPGRDGSRNEAERLGKYAGAAVPILSTLAFVGWALTLSGRSLFEPAPFYVNGWVWLVGGSLFVVSLGVLQENLGSAFILGAVKGFFLVILVFLLAGLFLGLFLGFSGSM